MAFFKHFRVEDAWSLAESHGISRKTTLQKLEDATLLYSTLRNGERNCFSVETEFHPIPTLDIEWISIKVTEVRIPFIFHVIENLFRHISKYISFKKPSKFLNVY